MWRKGEGHREPDDDDDDETSSDDFALSQVTMRSAAVRDDLDAADRGERRLRFSPEAAQQMQRSLADAERGSYAYVAVIRDDWADDFAEQLQIIDARFPLEECVSSELAGALQAAQVWR